MDLGMPRTLAEVETANGAGGREARFGGLQSVNEVVAEVGGEYLARGVDVDSMHVRCFLPRVGLRLVFWDKGVGRGGRGETAICGQRDSRGHMTATPSVLDNTISDCKN
jgi:hypothetical protein